MQGKSREVGYCKPPVETQFKPGQSGNPAGRPKSALISQALRQKLDEPFPDDEHGRTYAEVIAAKMAEKAASGEDRAIQEVIDRVEGKAKQTVNLKMDRRERLELAIRRIMEAGNCSREEAIREYATFEPDALTLMNTN